MNPAL
jgi:hypothetical protein